MDVLTEESSGEMSIELRSGGTDYTARHEKHLSLTEDDYMMMTGGPTTQVRMMRMLIIVMCSLVMMVMIVLIFDDESLRTVYRRFHSVTRPLPTPAHCPLATLRLSRGQRPSRRARPSLSRVVLATPSRAARRRC